MRWNVCRMSLSLPPPAHMPCPDCGASVSREEAEGHRCDPERKLDFVMFQLRTEVDGFDQGLRTWLDSASGRFAQWEAEHRRLPPG